MSDWKEEAVERRDSRAAKTPETARSRTGPRKNKKKWCRGKVGVEHQPECRDYQDVKRWRGGTTALSDCKVLVCTACGKELDIYYNFGRHKPPAWVKPKSK